jgi:hypothetical protein
MNEKQVIERLNDAGSYSFRKEEDNYSRYDAFCSTHNTMLEIKCRRSFYNDTLIEKMKYDWNTQHAKENNYTFLYAVSMPREEGHTVYVFNPNELDIKWFTRKLPAQTDFKNKNWIDKEIAYIPISQALDILV